MPKEDVWELICEKLREEISAVQFDTWFKHTKGSNIMEDQIVKVYALNKWHAEFIEKTFGEKIKRILMDIGYPQIKIIFEGREDGKNKEFIKEDVIKKREKREDTTSTRLGLIKKYTFKNFIPGKNSELAFSAARAVAHSPGQEFNPFFIYGGVGLGKTHLLHAIGNDVTERRGNFKVLYLTAEDMLSKIVEALQQKKMNEFRTKIRNFDVLLIDDVHFLSKSEYLQEELHHTFNYFYQNKKQIVLTADRPPWDLENVVERLVDRFSWGLVTDIKPPDFETRLAILKLKANEQGVSFPEEVLQLIAQKVNKNVRILESCVIKLSALQSLKGIKITPEIAERELKEIFEASGKEPMDIVYTIADFYNIPKAEILSKKQKKETAHARHIAMYILRNHLNLTLVEIGKIFNRDHSTVKTAIEKVERLLQKENEIKNELRELERVLREM